MAEAAKGEISEISSGLIMKVLDHITVFENGNLRIKFFDGTEFEWWQNHRDEINYGGDKIFTHICNYCGKKYTSYGESTKNRKYCSRECYFNGRFGEKHTLTEISVRIKEWSLKKMDEDNI